MEIADFKIRQVIFEARYAEAYVLWDRAGAIARDMCGIWPGLKLVEGQPNQQYLRSEDVTVTTGFQTSHIALAQPNGIAQFSKQVEETLRTWVAALEVKSFLRIGTRVIFSRSYASTEAANKAFVELGLVKAPEPPFFNHRASMTSGEVKLLWLDDVSQTQIIIKPERVEVEFGGLPDSPRDKQKLSSDVLLVDIDRATRGSVEISKFRVDDWLEGVRHLINRDIGRILDARKK